MNGTTSHHSKSSTDFTNDGEPPTVELLKQLDELTGQTPAQRAQRQRLCDEIIARTLPVADRLAAHYGGRGVPMDDLRQVARTALVQAMRRFHGAGENSFLAYAVPSIRGELKRYFRDMGWMVRPPRRIQEARLAINNVQSDLSNDLGRDPSPEELAELTGFDTETVCAARGADHCYRPDSLDRPRGVDEQAQTVGDVTGDFDPGFSQAEARVVIWPLLEKLAPRDRKLIILRFFKGMTQSEVGKRIGISQMQVSRVESRILEGFREALAA
ncbi:MAG TPA: sigma-70 family RNA polymerase sigma factor [Aeromicrobium sp.]|nr:sigma-70 family RNA polymerase sigma factor [Aeromicrobium sp.]HKY59327.1 sigma-70 family RNA polymerase sigma factor [Aeromicrobium sp.]